MSEMEFGPGKIISFLDPFNSGKQTSGLIIERFGDSHEYRVIELEVEEGKYVLGRAELLLHADDITGVTSVVCQDE